ncbi:uncharacterized protein RJT20DRAFT_38343 [Scheffersomyces xylosifermentans]|uniref:uncharacterized protein n=1 Tax=Scheffersomyces xylosifermentans TaxID=1304137 RepID=UPI00315D20AC
MSDYNSNTVPQLKELLKGRGLSTDGKKADLVARLVENDSAAPVAEEQPAEAAPVAEEAAPTAAETTETAPSENAASEEVKPQEEPVSAESQPAEKEEEPPKVLTAEERKQLAVDLLTKKISRAQKFGDEAGAEAAKKDLVRVEKFGVEAGTALAKEIGLVDRSLGNGFKKRFNGKRRNNNRKGFKPRGDKRRN